MGLPNEKHSGTPAVIQKHYGHLRTAALSLAGVLLSGADVPGVCSLDSQHACSLCLSSLPVTWQLRLSYVLESLDCPPACSHVPYNPSGTG